MWVERRKDGRPSQSLRLAAIRFLGGRTRAERHRRGCRRGKRNSGGRARIGQRIQHIQLLRQVDIIENPYGFPTSPYGFVERLQEVGGIVDIRFDSSATPATRTIQARPKLCQLSFDMASELLPPSDVLLLRRSPHADEPFRSENEVVWIYEVSWWILMQMSKYFFLFIVKMVYSASAATFYSLMRSAHWDHFM